MGQAFVSAADDVHHEIQKEHFRIELILIVIVATLVVALGAVRLWTSKETSDLVFTCTVVGMAVGLSLLT